MPNTQVHESLLFSAHLRLPSSVGREEAAAFVDEVRGEWTLSLCVREEGSFPSGLRVPPSAFVSARESAGPLGTY